ncbi:MAG TPA: hypothetical protein VGQ49_16615 [Bryobacteraceae bacterium]|jgi:hypothetical protein|nr:hypothetical protein [Bryobacteraceae bacterium]
MKCAKCVTKRRRESQQGYALLMIFLMAAIIALMLYQQLPRVAFESEREKEQLLIDRGEQYTRAIQLYYLANNRTYPTSIDDLEKRERRFLRRRFVDPFTGKADWRIVHTNGGFLTDSLVKKPPTATDGQSQSASNAPGSTNGATTSATNSTIASATNSTNAPTEPPQINAAVLQRPSDRPVTPPGFGQPGVVQDPSGQPNTPLPPITLQPQPGQAALPPITLQPGSVNQPGGLPPITLAPVGGAGGQPNTVNGGLNPGQVQGQIPGQIPGQIAGQLQPQIPGQFQATPGQIVPPVAGQVPGQFRPPQGAATQFGQPAPGGLPGGMPGVPPGFQIDPSGQLVPNSGGPGQGVPGLQQGGQPQGFPGQAQGIPGQPFTPQPPTSGPVQGSPSAALNAINQLLTTPRQIGTPASTPTSSNQIGAIAGIASTHTGPSIKLYKDQQKYELWEFVFDPTASTMPGGVPGGLVPGMTPGMTPGNAPGAGGPGQPGQTGMGAPSTFAPSGTFGPGGGQQPAFGPNPGR